MIYQYVDCEKEKWDTDRGFNLLKLQRALGYYPSFTGPT
jgi:hypothetical protein